MMTGFAEAWILAAQLDDIQEPYRHNAIAWLETCTQRRLALPRRDLLAFLEDLHPVVRADFLRYAGSVLDDAVRHFGRQGPDAGMGIAVHDAGRRPDPFALGAGSTGMPPA